MQKLIVEFIKSMDFVLRLVSHCEFTVFSYLLTLSIYSDVHENWQIFPLHKFTIGLKVQGA